MVLSMVGYPTPEEALEAAGLREQARVTAGKIAARATHRRSTRGRMSAPPQLRGGAVLI